MKMTDEQKFSLLPFLSAPQCSHSITTPFDFHEAGVFQKRGRRLSNLEIPPQFILEYSASVSFSPLRSGSIKRRNNALIGSKWSHFPVVIIFSNNTEADNGWWGM